MTAPPAPGRLFAQGLGFFLFLFIPLVLFLFVRHPAPVGASLAVGVILIVAHRAVARPWAAQVRQAKCLWCNRMLADAPAVDLELQAGTERLVARACPEHRLPAAKFFSWIDRAKVPLRLGIFLPLLARRSPPRHSGRTKSCRSPPRSFSSVWGWRSMSARGAPGDIWAKPNARRS